MFIIDAPLVVNCSVPVCDGPLKEIYCIGPILTAAWQFGLQVSPITNRFYLQTSNKCLVVTPNDCLARLIVLFAEIVPRLKDQGNASECAR